MFRILLSVYSKPLLLPPLHRKRANFYTDSSEAQMKFLKAPPAVSSLTRTKASHPSQEEFIIDNKSSTSPRTPLK